jgi:DNA-binding CsgD family transcriptional regulator
VNEVDAVQDAALRSQVDLSDMEIEVLRHIAEGKPSQSVAQDLGCSKRTIDAHLSSIYLKLGVSNRIQVIRRAIVMGLLNFPGAVQD